MSNTNTCPHLKKALVHEPVQVSPGAQSAEDLGPIAALSGTWTNKNIHGTNQGGPKSPYSYNVMPLPQNDPSSPTGYILKNFSYYEEITFSNIHGNAPNRGGSGTQVANTLLYEQRVFFAEGPNQDALVHAENGSWLYLSDRDQFKGPYGDGNGDGIGQIPLDHTCPPTQRFNIVKQISVPHGNSILAAGGYREGAGAPQLPLQTAILPVGVNTEQYWEESVGNPNPEFTLNPNLPLRLALEAGSPTSHLRFDVDTAISGHPVTNIGFEQQHAKVVRYSASYWLEAFGNSEEFTQLQYSQAIYMSIPIPGVGNIIFPHVTTNTLTKISD